MAEAQDIFQYLPLSFKTPSEQEYIEFLWSSFDSNYQNGKFQFAFLAYHMMYMSAVYFNIWQINKSQNEDFKKALIGFEKEQDIFNATSPFTYSIENESRIFNFLKLIGCDNSKIGRYKKIVRDRNEIAHTNGNIPYKAKDSIDRKIDEIIDLLEEIQIHSEPMVKDILIKFLKDYADESNWEYSDVSDQIKEILIHKNYMSNKDIEHLLKFKVNVLSKDEGFDEMKELFNSFTDTYSNT
jgi:uncharacterized protein YihD (DUF1040 family)